MKKEIFLIIFCMIFLIVINITHASEFDNLNLTNNTSVSDLSSYEISLKSRQFKPMGKISVSDYSKNHFF